jgi:hypothetical protein
LSKNRNLSEFGSLLNSQGQTTPGQFGSASILLNTDTSGSYVASANMFGAGLGIIGSGVNAADIVISSSATPTNAPSSIVFRDASGNFSAGTITSNGSVVQTALNIADVARTGSANVFQTAQTINTQTFGALLLQYSSSVGGFGIFGKTPLLQLMGDGTGANSQPNIAMVQYNIAGLNVGQASPELYLATSRGSAGNVRGALANGDPMGGIGWFGDDGLDVRTRAAWIQSSVDTTLAPVSASQIPVRLAFGVASSGSITFHTNAGLTKGGYGTQTAGERMRITATGLIGIGTINPATTLDVIGTVGITSTLAVSGTLSAKGGILVTGNVTATNFFGTASDASVLVPLDIRALAPTSGGIRRISSFFTAWNQDGASPYADALLFNTYIDATGGSTNLLLLRKTGALGIRLYQNAFGTGSVYSTFKDVAWTDGTNATGTWTINITGSVSGTLTQAAQPNVTSVGTSLTVGANTQTNASIRTRVNGNAFEFGHTNQAGYASTLGANVGSGKAFLAFHAEAGTNNNTYLTRGVSGVVVQSDLVGGLTVLNIPLTASDNQAGTSIFSVSSAGAVSASSYTGVMGTPAQPNITSLGTLGSLTVSGLTTAQGGVSGTLTQANQPNITAVGTLTALTVSGSITQTGSFDLGVGQDLRLNRGDADPGIVALAGKNIRVIPSGSGGPVFLFSGSGQFQANALDVTTAIGVKIRVGTTDGLRIEQAGTNLWQFAGLGSTTFKFLPSVEFVTGLSGSLTQANQPNVTGLGTLTNLAVTNTITGSISGSHTGLVLTPAQPNITSLGTLGSLSVTGASIVTTITGTTTDAVLRYEVARISSLGRAAATGTGSRSTLIGFQDSANATIVGAMGGLRLNPSGNYNGGLIFYVNNSGGTPSTDMTTLTEGMRLDSAGILIVSGGISGSIAQAAQPNITSLGTLVATLNSNMSSGQANIALLGSPTNVTQILLGTSSVAGSVGTEFSSGQAYIAYNAAQVAIGTNNWQQNNASFSSQMIKVENTGWSYYTSVAGHATASSAGFWGTPVATISNAGIISASSYTGVLSTPGQPNITSLGTLTGLNVSATTSIIATLAGTNATDAAMALNASAISASSYTIYQSQGVGKAYVGMAGNTNSLINGAGPRDLALRTEGTAMRFSVDAGTSSAMFISSSRTLVASQNLIVGGTLGGSGVAGDIVARRASNTGAYYFGESANNYLFFDGTNYNFGGGNGLNTSAITAAGTVTVTTGNGIKFNAVDGGMFVGATNVIYVGDYASPSKGLRVNFSTGAVSTTHGLTVTNQTQTDSVYSTSGTGGITPMRVAFPGGGAYAHQNASVTGAIKIKFPTATLQSSHMLRFTVKIYNYNGGTSHTFEIGGYNYNATPWQNVYAYQTSDTGGQFNVRFGRDSTSECVWIGETGTSWSYPQVFVTDLQTGFNAALSSWATGWVISTVTSFDTVEVTHAPAFSLTSNNYNSYSPTLTGGGASGTWGIGITGNAGGTLQGLNVSDVASTSTIVARTGAGYIFSNYINTTDDTSSTLGLLVGKVGSGDNYHRSYSAATVRSFLGMATTSDVTFNSLTASTYLRSNGYVYTDASYGYGHVGVYAASTYSLIYAMGSPYLPDVNGANIGTAGGNGVYAMLRAYDDTTGTGKNITGNQLGHGFGWVSANAFVNFLGTGIWTTGNSYAAAFYTNSSRALKQDIAPFSRSALDIVNNTLIVDFRYKNKPEVARVGFIAEDTDAVLTGDNGDKFDTTNTLAVALKAIQELSTRVNELEKLIASK